MTRPHHVLAAVLAGLALAACQQNVERDRGPWLEVSCAEIDFNREDPCVIDFGAVEPGLADDPALLAEVTEPEPVPARAELDPALLARFPIVFGDPALIAEIGAPPRETGADGRERIAGLPQIPLWDNWTHKLHYQWEAAFAAEHGDDMRRVSQDWPLPAVWRLYVPQPPHRQSGAPRTLVLEAYEDPVVGLEVSMFLHDETGWRQFENKNEGKYFGSSIPVYERVGFSRARVSPPDMEPVWLDLGAIKGLEMGTAAFEDSFAKGEPVYRIGSHRDDSLLAPEFTVLSQPDDQAPVLLTTTPDKVEAYLAARAIPFEQPNVDVVAAGETQGDWLAVEVVITTRGSHHACGTLDEDEQVIRVSGWLRFRTPQGIHLLDQWISTC